jgi:hypothetical protein
MANPFSRIVPDAKITFSTDALADKPSMAVLVSKIFALWSDIDYRLGLLLVQILRADEHPAVAMYSTITSQYMQSIALDAAAKAALSRDDYGVFRATIGVVESVTTPRNQLAHWIWGVCEQRPDLLALADPKHFKSTQLKQRRAVLSRFDVLPQGREIVIDGYDSDHIVGYSEADLERTVCALDEARQIVLGVGYYFDAEFMKTLLQSNRHGGAIQAMSLEQWRSEWLKVLKSRSVFLDALNRANNQAGTRNP